MRYLYDLEPQNALTDIFGAVKSAGVEYDHWCSDLYFPVTPETSQIVSLYAYKQNVSKFKDNITGKPWYVDRKPLPLDSYRTANTKIEEESLS